MRIARHHANSPYKPVCEWPEDCMVQWGGGGLVLSKKGSYTTAFFEAFPSKSLFGFVRGEGSDIEAAERDAFARFSKYEACGEHVFGRRGYLNGVGRCLKCNGLATKVFREVYVLKDIRAPLTYDEISSLSQGMLYFAATRTDTDELGSSTYYRRLRLRALVCGVRLPDPKACADEEAYNEAMEAALVEWAVARVRAGDPIEVKPIDSLSSLFNYYPMKSLKARVDAALAASDGA